MSPNSSQPSSQPPDSRRLSELLQQLHTANEHFSTARKHLETALDCTDFDCPNPRLAEDELRAAQRELDAITAKINEMLTRK